MKKTEPGRLVTLQSGDRMAIVAGSGRLPIDLAESLAAHGHAPFVLMVEGEADPALASYDHQMVAIEQFADLGTMLKRRRITHAVFAGGIGRRPRISALRPSLALFRWLPHIMGALGKGDDGVLRALAARLETYGVTVVGAHQIAPDLLASAGPMTGISPQKSDWRDIEAAAQAARAIGAIDVGQAAVAIGGRAIALEDIEGTDGLLARVKDLRSPWQACRQGARRARQMRQARTGTAHRSSDHRACDRRRRRMPPALSASAWRQAVRWFSTPPM